MLISVCWQTRSRSGRPWEKDLSLTAKQHCHPSTARDRATRDLSKCSSHTATQTHQHEPKVCTGDKTLCNDSAKLTLRKWLLFFTATRTMWWFVTNIFAVFVWNFCSRLLNFVSELSLFAILLILLIILNYNLSFLLSLFHRSRKDSLESESSAAIVPHELVRTRQLESVHLKFNQESGTLLPLCLRYLTILFPSPVQNISFFFFC